MAIRSPQHKVHEEAVDLTLVLAGDRTNFEGGLLNEIVAGIIRHALTALGCVLVGAGYLTSDEWTTIAGALEGDPCC
jgi:hypothetical protein